MKITGHEEMLILAHRLGDSAKKAEGLSLAWKRNPHSDSEGLRSLIEDIEATVAEIRGSYF